jgi:hypothetical protein
MSEPRTIYTATDGTHLEFDMGNFDEWCVWERRSDGSKFAPRDVDYFRKLLNYGETFGHTKVYSDFVAVYDVAGREVTNEAQKVVKARAYEYQTLKEDAEKTFMILLMSMIAENRKRNTRLGKRIKRLGVHDLLLVSRNVMHAANFMRGMKWHEIDCLCREYGF